MRMRYKAWAAPELNASPFFVRTPAEQIGRWHQWFPRRQPIHLELGCGKGLFLAGIAPIHPEINYMGIDLKDTVLAPAKRNIEKAFADAGRPVDNVVLLPQNIERIQDIMNAEDMVERIYINFCNPWPRPKHNKRRLTYPRMLESYKQFLQADGEIWFKTDNDQLFDDSIAYLEQSGFTVLRQTRDLHADQFMEDIRTEHENMFSEQGIPVKALIAQKNRSV